METEHVPSPFAIAFGAVMSTWCGIALAGLGLVFTPVIDASVKENKPSGSSTAAKKKDEAKDAAPKKFEEGNLNAPFVTYERGQEKSGSNWKAMVEGITTGKSPAKFTSEDLNMWSTNAMSFKSDPNDTVVPERPNFLIREGKFTASAWVNTWGTKVALSAQGDFSGSNHGFKISSGRFGSCPLPGFATGWMIRWFYRSQYEVKSNKAIIEAWPKFQLVAVEGDVLNIIP